MNEDLDQMTREELIGEVEKLRQGIRAHRDPGAVPARPTTADSKLSVKEEPASYGAEDELVRINRRKRVWTPTTIITGS